MIVEERHRRDEGYALVAAVAALAVFAGLALVTITATRARVVVASADLDRARAGEAADAALAIGLEALARGDEAMRSAIDGPERTLHAGGATVSLALVDERGKVPINLEDEGIATRLVAAAGLTGEAAETARDSLLDWLDSDDDPRPHGAERDWYARQGIAPRNAGLASFGELARVRGFTPAALARLRGLVTVDPAARAFDAAHAEPGALAIVAGEGEAAVGEIERQRERAGAVTAFAFGSAATLVGRPITLTARAALPGGGATSRSMTVRLTGRSDPAYVIDAVE